MDRVFHVMQSMTGTLKGQPQTSMISHLANVFFGYTQLEGRQKAINTPVWRPAQAQSANASSISGMSERNEQDTI